MTQDAVFVASEADRWFERNRAALEKLDLSADLPLRVIDLYGVRPRTVLEIGGSNGYRVAELCRRTGATGSVLEPSAAAIADGRRRFPNINFHQGEARTVPIEASFDLVIVNYVLHWIDRANLFRVIAELDRLVADGGHLLIGDFHPWAPTRVRYHHLAGEEVYTFKQDYAALFVASGLYQPVCLMSAEGNTLHASVTDAARAATTLLRKRSSGVYATAEFRP